MSVSSPLRRLSRFNRSSSASSLAGGTLPPGWSKLTTPTIAQGAGHVLVGPGGVYYIEVTRRTGATRVSANTGASDPSVERCRLAAGALGRKLTLALGAPTVVHPVVVVEGADVQVIEQPMGVTIIASALLSDYLTRQPNLMRESGVQRIRSAILAA